MNIRDQTRKLEKSVENLSAIRRYHGDRAKKVALRLEQLAAAANLDALRILPSANCHELKADGVGEIAVDISPNHRIIFIPDHHPLPKKDIFIREIIMDKLLIDKAMEMPPVQRVALAELLLASIDHEEEEISETWISEVHERMTAVNEGRATLLDFDSLLP